MKKPYSTANLEYIKDKALIKRQRENDRYIREHPTYEIRFMPRTS